MSGVTSGANSDVSVSGVSSVWATVGKDKDEMPTMAFESHASEDEYLISPSRDNKYVICWEHHVTFVFQFCGHLCICE